MDGVVASRIALSALLAVALAAKLINPRPLAPTIAAGLRVGARSARLLGSLTLAVELTAAVGLLIPVTAPGAALLALIWVAGSAVFWAVALPAGVEGCGCLGRLDPLRSLGPARRFAYLLPYGLLAAVVVSRTATLASLASVGSIFLVGAVTGLIALPPILSSLVRPLHAQPIHADGSRRQFLARSVALAVAYLLLPFAQQNAALADTCGAFSCVRFYTICSCRTCSNGQSSDGCYKYVCRTCTGPYGSYQQCGYVLPTWCYANICSPCGRRYISNCGCCSPCTI